MTRPLVLRPLAQLDAESSFEEYEGVRIGLGDRFRGRLASCLESIERVPELYGRIWKEVRAVKLKRFRHVVYYIVYDDRVEVFAVIHGAKRTSAWRKRFG